MHSTSLICIVLSLNQESRNTYRTKPTSISLTPTLQAPLELEEPSCTRNSPCFPIQTLVNPLETQEKQGKMASKALLFLFFLLPHLTWAQDYDEQKAAPPPALDNCDGVFLSYAFINRVKEFPHTKNASAQAWAFKSQVTIVNAMAQELKAWKIFIGFQYDEIMVSADGAVLMDGNEFPAPVGKNGTYLSGFPMTDLKSSIETAGDFTQIQVQIDIKGSQFGLKPPRVPMPKTIRLANEGYKCPAPVRHKTEMHVCCVRNKKLKANLTDGTKFLPRQNGDLILYYDILQAFEGNYLAQVTMDNNHPLGRLDNWNLTWEWKRGEFIYSMRGAYTLEKDYSDCIYGAAGNYYKDFDFTPVMNCQNRPIIADLPPEKEKDEKIGNLPFCCKNGTLLPSSMNSTKSKAIFQLQVYKIQPDMNRTALYPPQSWKIKGVLNPDYKCGQPIRVSPTQFPDTSGLLSTTSAIATWQVVCNITRPKQKNSRCCVSFSAYYNDSVIPCNTCACGCPDTNSCSPNAAPLLLPSEALLVPFANRTAKAKAWAQIKHYNVPKPLPCPDNCGVSINWHIFSDYRKGWTARITIFNWEGYEFHDWFTAVQLSRAFRGYEKVYSFNGTKMEELNNTLFMQGLPGLTYLIPLTNGTNPKADPPVPGKQQSVISFKKKLTPGLSILRGDGFPTKVFFNGEECALPTQLPKGDAYRSHVNLLPKIFLTVMVFMLMMDHLC